MVDYVIRRLLIAVFTTAVLSFVIFGIIQLPKGDFVDFYIIAAEIEQETRITPEEAEAMREAFGLNRPLVVQYWDWISKIIFKGDFGVSWRGGTSTSIRRIMVERVPATILFAATSSLMIWFVGLPIGVYSAVRHHSLEDYTATFAGFIGLSIPDFLFALVLMYAAFTLFDFKVGGLYSGDYQFAPWSVGRVWDLLLHLIIPSIVIGTAGTAGLIRIMRNNLLDELRKPYVVTARAKGQTSWKVIARYPVRVALNPFISGIGGTLPALIGGVGIVSIVLSLPTLGPVLLEAVLRQDQLLAGTVLLMMTVLTIVGVLISDLMLVLIDPRISLTGRRS